MRRALVVCGAVVGIVAAGTVLWVAQPLPPELLALDASGVTILDRHGTLLRTTRASDGSRAAWVRYADIDADVINAFVAVEDRRFWSHAGVDWRAVARATWQNVRARRVVSGASTITMQLARLARPGSARWSGKAAQALWALRIEWHLDKQRILEEYLNRVHLGQATVGVGPAAALYFATSAGAVSAGQAATLAGLAHAPSRDNPLVSPRRAAERRALALRRMRHAGYLTRNDMERAAREPLIVAPRTPPFFAPHFTTWVLSALPASRPAPAIATSLDAALQTEVEAEVRHTVSVMRDRNVQHAAAVVLDNRTGAVIAWVGSPEFWSSDGQTDMVNSPRQPGSALKPFLYALALDRGYTAASVLPDVPATYATPAGSYAPRNYDRRFRGPTRVREALASSYNVPAVELTSRLGTGSLLQTLRRAGFVSLSRDAEHYGLGLALGNGDVTLVELANAYRALANGGEWRPWTWQAAPHQGSTETARVASRLASAIVLDILRDPTARVPGFGLITPFDFPFAVAVKTGTSRHFTDNWAVGVTQGFTVAVWAGNFDGRAMHGVGGITGAGPLLHRVVLATAKRVPPGALETPAAAGAVAVPVCRLSGMAATSACAQLTEWFVPGTEPREPDTWERGGRMSLPPEYVEWAAATSPPVLSRDANARVDGGAAPQIAAAPFHIVSPREGDRYALPVGVEARYATLALRASAPGARWSVNGRALQRDRWPLAPGEHEFVAVLPSGERDRVRIVVER